MAPALCTCCIQRCDVSVVVHSAELEILKTYPCVIDREKGQVGAHREGGASTDLRRGQSQYPRARQRQSDTEITLVLQGLCLLLLLGSSEYKRSSIAS